MNGPSVVNSSYTELWFTDELYLHHDAELHSKMDQVGDSDHVLTPSQFEELKIILGKLRNSSHPKTLKLSNSVLLEKRSSEFLTNCSSFDVFTNEF